MLTRVNRGGEASSQSSEMPALSGLTAEERADTSCRCQHTERLDHRSSADVTELDIPTRPRSDNSKNQKILKFRNIRNTKRPIALCIYVIYFENCRCVSNKTSNTCEIQIPINGDLTFGYITSSTEPYPQGVHQQLLSYSR